MHSTWVRGNAVVFYALSVLGVLAGMCACTTYWHVPAPKVSVLRLNELSELRSQPYRDGRVVDRAVLTFDLDADLTSVFNWNTKQLFVYIVAEYETESNKLNQVVVWDKIVQDKADAHLTLRDQYVKYPLIDMHDELRGTDVELKLMWDPMPISGMLSMAGKGRHRFGMPEDYQ
jgi:signal peptidase complex subunit 3